ncbi:hypothetical protein AAC387_Pa06g0877 [Persea americana]
MTKMKIESSGGNGFHVTIYPLRDLDFGQASLGIGWSGFGGGGFGSGLEGFKCCIRHWRSLWRHLRIRRHDSMGLRAQRSPLEELEKMGRGIRGSR